MDLNLFEHTLVAAAVQTLIGMLTGRWWIGGAMPSCYFIGRELAQARAQLLNPAIFGLRAEMPWHAAFDPRVWETADQIADWLGPVIVTLAIALIAPRIAAQLDRPALDDPPCCP